MPSPFPGMDPYLENPGLWPDVHSNLIVAIQEALNARLRPKYHARVEERVYVSDVLDPGRSVLVPDLGLHERPAKKPVHHVPTATAVGTAEPIVATTLIDEEIRESFLKIVDRDGHSIVTVIEVLSPTNKYPAAAGALSYGRKRRDLMTSETHLVEIDLLRGGTRMAILGDLPESQYLIHISTVQERPQGRLWTIGLTERLPVVPIPLQREDADVPLDLQAILSTAYDRAAYDLEIDYRREPVPPLDAELAAWSDRLLKERGLR